MISAEEELPLEMMAFSLTMHQLYRYRRDIPIYISGNINWKPITKPFPELFLRKGSMNGICLFIRPLKTKGLCSSRPLKICFNFLWSKMLYWCAEIHILLHKGSFIFITYQIISAFSVSVLCVLKGVWAVSCSKTFVLFVITKCSEIRREEIITHKGSRGIVSSCDDEI